MQELNVHQNRAAAGAADSGAAGPRSKSGLFAVLRDHIHSARYRAIAVHSTESEADAAASEIESHGDWTARVVHVPEGAGLIYNAPAAWRFDHVGHRAELCELAEDGSYGDVLHRIYFRSDDDGELVWRLDDKPDLYYSIGEAVGELPWAITGALAAPIGDDEANAIVVEEGIAEGDGPAVGPLAELIAAKFGSCDTNALAHQIAVHRAELIHECGDLPPDVISATAAALAMAECWTGDRYILHSYARSLQVCWAAVQQLAGES